MAFDFPDDAFLAALSFVEEFTFSDAADEDARSNAQLVQGIAAPPLCSEPVIVDSDTLKQRRRRQANERKKQLRKSGIYADPNQARSERRQEIARLREQLEQLQLDVQVLRGRKTDRPRTAARSQNDVSLPSQVPAVWQGMAMRQRQRRQESERENIHLKLVVKRQQQVAQTLGALVRRRAFQLSKECADLSTQSSLTHHVVNILDIEGDMEDFRILFHRMETAYRGVGDLFAANGLASSDLPLDEVYLRESVDGGYLECFSHKVLPFELRATAEVVWEHFKGIEKHYRNGSLYTKAAKDMDEPYTIIENFTKEMYSNASRADITVKQVVRRYVERDRDVVIWVARVSPAQIKHKMLRGLTYNLRGYAVTERSQAAGQEVSMLQQCSLISFDQDAGGTCSPTHLDALMNFLVGNSAQNIRSHRQRIEDMLVDQADGDGAFEAALSFLDEFATCSTVGEDAPQQILDDTQDAPGQETKRRRGLTDEEKKQRRAEHNERRKLLRKAGVYGDANRARNGRAREITRLREQAEKLQIDLQILQTQSADKDPNLENECALAKRVPGSQTTRMWQELAEQQRRRLLEVERDNVLLRLAVERQRKVASSLQTQMQRRSTQLTNECASLVTTACANPRSFNVLDFRGDMESFRGLFQRLDDAYQQLDQVFMNNGLASLTLAPGDVHLHERKEKSFEFASFKVLPFDVRSTAEATWTHFKGVEKHLVNGSLYEKAEKGLDEPYTIIADFKKETFSSSSRADIQVKQVIRRYVEEDRDVVIWVARAGSIEVKHKLLQGLTYHLLGYAVTRRSSESTPDREVSVLQLCYKVSLDQGVPANLQSLTDFLVTTTAENIRAHRERIENALIDRSLRPRMLGQ